MRVLRENTAALIVDIQERLYDHLADKETFAKKAAMLCEGLKQLHIPLLPVEMYKKGLGPIIPPLQGIFDGAVPLEKLSFSCLDEPKITEALAALQKKFIIVAGSETHVCVQQTVLDLLARAYVPVVIEDCVASRKKQDKETALLRMRSAGVLITSAESILFELCRYSGTDEFKAILKLVK